MDKHCVLFKDITIAANRQRKEFDPEALTDLSNSISQVGLLHPIVLRETPLGFVLVAGERRLRAMDTLWMLGDGVRYNGLLYEPYEVPYVTLGELSPLEAEEAELDENLKRRDLTWQERSEALGRLHALRVAQAGEAGESHVIADTLREVETTDYSGDRQAILISQHLDNPEVAAARTVKDAFKIIKRDEERQKMNALAEQVGAQFNSSVHTLIKSDCIQWLKECPENTFDVILTDPPYGMNADSFGDGGGKLENAVHRYNDSPASFSSLMGDFCPLIYRAAKTEAHAYIFCDLDQFHYLKALMIKAGWDVFRTPLIVYKLGSGRVPRPEHGPRRQYELCLYAIKGNRPVTGIFSDVIPCRLEENIGHGANKPIELFVDLLRRSIRPGDSVLDAFAGTGTIFPAAHTCKVYATGIELNPEYYGISVKRLNALDNEPSMI
jgi:DNA modification methylase/ParB-like chromosome segregation protein Spo0J